MTLDQRILDKIIKEALSEDLDEKGDLTTQAIFPELKQAKAQIIFKSQGVIAGLTVARRVFKTLDPQTTVVFAVKEGSFVEGGAILARVKGPLQSILGAERTALN